MTYKPTYYARKWMTLADGGSDQWLYVARSKDGTYVFLEVIDFVAYAGSDAEWQWSARVCSVDLLAAPPEQLQSALRSCGQEEDPPDLATEQGRIAMAEMCFSYGAHAPLWDDCQGKPRPEYDRPSDTSKDFLKIRAEARRHAEEALDDAAREETLDSKIVNALGQTAREYASGDIWGTLRKIKADPDATPAQKLTLSLYAQCEQTLGGERIPEDIKP